MRVRRLTTGTFSLLRTVLQNRLFLGAHVQVVRWPSSDRLPMSSCLEPWYVRELIDEIVENDAQGPRRCWNQGPEPTSRGHLGPSEPR